MSSKMMTTADLTVQFGSKSSLTLIPQGISNISLASRIRSRKESGPRRAGRIEAFYAPPVEAKESLYQVLGIGESGSSFADIKKAYKQMARKYHPDVSPPERVDENTRRFIMVHEAYETLSNPQARAVYDRAMAAPRTPQHYGQSEDWRTRWHSQLDQLHRRDSTGRTSWGARMRNSTHSASS